MKNSKPQYAFNKTEIQLLRELAKGKQSFLQIKKLLQIKSAFLSRNLKKLQQKGIIQTAAEGNRKNAYFSETKHASLLRDLLLSFDFMDWENILSGKSIEILFQTLDDGDLSGFSGATRWRYLKELKARGIITETQKGYRINTRFSILADFLKEYRLYFVNKISKALSENSVILWQKDMEFLVRVPTSAEAPTGDFHKTATSIFPAYNLPLFSEFDVYFYSTTKKSIKPEDAVLHTLLLELGNVRYSTYALLLLKKTEKQIDKTYLLREAEHFGLENQVKSMLKFLQTHIRPEGQPLPSWNDFADKARDYGVMA
jgi:DNA-binding MarR family transcriptional regulator